VLILDFVSELGFWILVCLYGRFLGCKILECVVGILLSGNLKSGEVISDRVRLG
jgi:hypothetical protein